MIQKRSASAVAGATAVFIATAVLLTSCNLFHDEYPSRSCNANADCFAASGEICDMELGKCVPAADAAPVFDADTTDAVPVPDADTTDADTTDAETPDA